MTTAEAIRDRTQAEPAEAQRDALLELLYLLDRDGYDFVTVTPGSHARVLARPGRDEARSARDVLGWSLPFREDVLPSTLLALLRSAGAVSHRPDGHLGCDIRVS